MSLVVNAGEFNARIEVLRTTIVKDSQGFESKTTEVILQPYAKVKTTKGFTLISNGSDFEKATTNFTIRYPERVEITRKDIIRFKGKTYEILYLNNVNEAGVILEMQAKEVTH